MPLMTDAGTLKLITVVGVVKDGLLLLVDYKDPPVPRKQGWWIPAPEFDYGEHPDRSVEAVLSELGLDGAPYRLVEIESTLRGTGWHLVMHYRVDADREPSPVEVIRKVSWFGLAELPPAEAFAMGATQRQMAERHLGLAPPSEASAEPRRGPQPRVA